MYDARSSGKRSRLLFAFAGHGDVDGGKGTLELEGSSLFPDDVRAILDAIDADETHLLFDSCNSFFVVHPRRPGGKAFATREAPGTSISTKRGAPGVFLSTSAEAQVWEWSQLEGGIFSHAIRSGLAGAADLNRDHRITYRELESFVEVAVADIDDAVYRPRLYVKAESDDTVIVELKGDTDRTLVLDGFAGRLTLRDPRGVRLVDVHPAPGYSPRLHVPKGPLELIAELPDAGRKRLGSLEISDDIDTVRPADVGVGDGAARGASAALEKLFLRPFGPDAVTSGARGDDVADVVYGLTRAQEERITLQLRIFADDGQRRRLSQFAVGAVGSVGVGTFFAASAAAYGFDLRSVDVGTAVAIGAAVALPAAAAGVVAVMPTPEEDVLAAFEAAPHATPQQRAVRAAAAVEAYEAHADDDNIDTWVYAGALVSSGVVLAAAGAVLTQAQLTLIQDGVVVGAEPFDELRLVGAAIVAAGIAEVIAGASFPLWQRTGNQTLTALMVGDPEPVIDRDAPGVEATP